MTSAATRSGNVVRLLDVRDRPLDVAEVLAAVADPAAGGLNVFVGAVRDHDDGHDVVRLEYTAHPTAIDQLAAVAAEVAAEFDAIAIAAVHRTGVLEVGDLAVVSAVSAAHRGEAFEASRALIDRLKQRVPIWKHQIFADGTDEWVNGG
ncbi:MAG TPA: molybdenum cofactor biosynthesis protein MoaE [Marmoricola sp.]|nr:molybdenum cofactor biosynthesis protein MoaE [Marmoricola sp.]